uniref:Uncharacterized protein n=2 Tax=Clytia hemisphaerica TaxID=252671 RepID=A0A7M5X5T1_9CNID
MDIFAYLFVIGLFSGAVLAANDERNCSNGKALEPYPATVKNTTLLLKDLRQQMRNKGVEGYVIPTADEHQTEYVAPWFKRLAFISGFKGSAGTVLVTLDKAALWVDGRYHKQAETEVDCNWIIQKYGNPGVPRIADFVATELRDKTLGADPRIISLNTKRAWMQSKYVTWKNVDENLVDKVWANRPKETEHKVFVQPFKYSGQYFTEKITNLRNTLNKSEHQAMIVDALDDVAWLLNLRGDDIPYIPFFYAYVIVEMQRVRLYINQNKVTQAVRDHLCNKTNPNAACVEIKDYDYQILGNDISAMTQSSNKSILITGRTSVFIASSIPEAQQAIKDSPIQLPKAKKNAVELEGMRIANIRDGVSIMQFFLWLKKEVGAGRKVTELSASRKLEYFKSLQKNYVSMSFSPIAGFGSNAAIIHYRANNITDRQITDKSTFLLDCGSQFYEGSTDITRTVHLGKPTAFQKETYTLVLQGAIGLANVKFPAGTYGRNIDVLARKALWDRGLGYKHGTGHGIGSFLSIHEGPGRINTGRTGASETTLWTGMVFSDEPGYYKNGEFGIRLETAIVVQPVELKYHNMKFKTFYGFEVLTLVPFDRNLINVEMLSQSELDWLNSYNKKIRDVMGKEIKSQGDKNDVYEYMMDLTELFTKEKTSSSGHRIRQNTFILLAFVILTCMLVTK